MQIRLGTARALGYHGSAEGLLDPDTNMTYAVKYLAGAYRVANGNADRAVHYYQAGYYYAAKHQRVHMAVRAEPRVEARVKPRADPRKGALAMEPHELTAADKQIEPPTETPSTKSSEKRGEPRTEARVEPRADPRKEAPATEPQPLKPAAKQIEVPIATSSITAAERAEPHTELHVAPRPDPRKLALAEPQPDERVAKPAEAHTDTPVAKPSKKHAAPSHRRAEHRDSASPSILKRLVSLLTSRAEPPDEHRHVRKLRRARAQAANAASSSRRDLY